MKMDTMVAISAGITGVIERLMKEGKEKLEEARAFQAKVHAQEVRAGSSYLNRARQATSEEYAAWMIDYLATGALVEEVRPDELSYHFPIFMLSQTALKTIYPYDGRPGLVMVPFGTKPIFPEGPDLGNLGVLCPGGVLVRASTGPRIVLYKDTWAIMGEKFKSWGYGTPALALVEN